MYLGADARQQCASMYISNEKIHTAVRCRIQDPPISTSIKKCLAALEKYASCQFLLSLFAWPQFRPQAEILPLEPVAAAEI